MDSEILLKDMLDLCRTCMTPDPSLTSVFSIVNISGKVTKKESIASILYDCVSLQVEPSDGLPQSICNNCLKKLLSCHLFQFLCHDTQLKLQEIKDAQEQLTEAENSDNEEVICILNTENLDEQLVEAENIAMQGDSLSSSEKEEEVRDVNPLSTDNDATDQPVHQCKICSRVCSNRFTLNRHMKVHGDFKELQCHICLKRFATAEGKDRHLRVHTGEKPYNCEHCDRDFRQSSLLRTHLQKVHKIIPKKKTIEDREDSWKWSFLCTVCGHRYASSSGLTGHMKAKHREEHEKELEYRSKQIKLS